MQRLRAGRLHIALHDLRIVLQKLSMKTPWTACSLIPSCCSPQVVEIALNSALQRRPQTWGVRPPNALEFFMWCAISDETISGIVAMTKDDLDETQEKLPSS